MRMMRSEPKQLEADSRWIMAHGELFGNEPRHCRTSQLSQKAQCLACLAGSCRMFTLSWEAQWKMP